jgi:hypothetical protein
MVEGEVARLSGKYEGKNPLGKSDEMPGAV